MGRRAAWKHPYHDFFAPEWLSCARENDAAMNALERIVGRKDIGSLVIAVNPMYDNLRGDPRFAELLNRIYGRDVSKAVQQRLAEKLGAGNAMQLACPLSAPPA